MKKWNLFKFSLFILLCIAINLAAKEFAFRLELPVWFDTIGTILCAYAAGPICGSIVGITGNLIEGMTNKMALIYCLTSISIGVVVGLFAKKKALENWFGALTVGSLITITSIIVSVPLDLLVNNGSTGNKWGDGVIGRLTELGWPRTISVLTGQFYIEFLDKMVSVLLVFGAIQLYRKLFRKPEPEKKHERGPETLETIEKSITMLFVVFLTAGLFRSVSAEQPEISYNSYVQTVYSTRNGIPCGEANDIEQTTDGILWVGTYNGLYRYNGREFKEMKYDSIHNVNCLDVDEEGRLWVGTNDSGLSIIINDKVTTVLDKNRGLSADKVRGIVQSFDGNYYIGTSEYLQILSLNSGMKIVKTIHEIQNVTKIAANNRGHVAAVTNDGRLFLMKDKKILVSRQITEGKEKYSTCAFDSSGHLFAGTNLGTVYIFNVTHDGFDHEEIHPCEGVVNIKDLHRLNNGDIFVTADNGIGYLDNDNKYHGINTNEFNNSIDNMIIDYQGNFWFTSSRLGLLRLAPSSFRDVYNNIGLENEVVNAVAEWQGNFYFGTDSGMDVVNADCSEQVINSIYEKMKEKRIRCLFVDSSGSLWISTDKNGLYEIEADGTSHHIMRNGFNTRSRLVIELADGTILEGGGNGLSFIKNHKVQSTIDMGIGILTATELPDGRILVGTDGNGLAVVENGNVTDILTKEDGLGSVVILRTVYDSKGGGVFIMTGYGLDYMEADGTIRVLHKFPYNNNYDITITDNDRLFIMSSAGIYVVNREELLSEDETLNYELLNYRRGLTSPVTANSWNYIDENGNLYLPCSTGVFIVNINQYSVPVKTYRMSISSLILDGKEVENERGQSIVIDRNVSEIAMVPEFINYSVQNPTVGYYLEKNAEPELIDTGKDKQEKTQKNWHMQPEESLNSVVLTNLDPGEYTFYLGVFDDSDEGQSGAEIDEEKEQEPFVSQAYTLIKEKAIYDNSWFMVYMLVIPMLAVAWFTWFFVRRQVQHTLDLQQKEIELAHRQIQMGNDTVMAIAKAVDAKDVRTARHSQRVSLYSVMIARELGWTDEQCESLRKTALMHDIGKIGIPDSILNKPAKLTDEEYAIMKSHTVRGAEILKGLTFIDHVVEGAKYHHERVDGRGYPNGLKGDEIPINARIIGVADAFDAMTANRVYRKQMDFEYVFNEMRKGRGTQFDPQMDDILLKLIDEGKIDLNKLYDVKPDDDPVDIPEKKE